MKFNQWTLGLAAVGVVSMASAVRAEEGAVPLMTALSATTISGYVDVSLNWNESDYLNGSYPLTYPFQGKANKADGFNMNVVKLSFERAMDESEWAAGYKVDLLIGPDAVAYNAAAGGGGDLGIKQAYVALRTPVGNGIDWKIGAFDSIIGYESFEAGNNPNFTRSYGYFLEPTQHTGILGTYRITDNIAVAAGVANTLTAGLDTRNTELAPAYESFWRKTVMGSIAVTLPEDLGFLGNSTVYAGVVSGFDAGGVDQRDNWYLGATLNTPVTGLRVGAAFDYVNGFNGLDPAEAYSLAGYLSYTASEKLSLHGRVEWTDANDLAGVGTVSGTNWGITGTVQYDLWENVISRLEVRWDDVDTNLAGVGDDNVGLYANVIYKF